MNATDSMEGSGAPRSLVTLFLDGKEICNKMQELNTTAEIFDACKHLLNCDAECDRLLKFNKYFNEFIDTETDGNIDLELGKLLPGKQDLFLRKWERLIPKLLKVACLENYDDVLRADDDNDVRVTMLQSSPNADTLSPTASGRAKGWAKCSVKSAQSYILDIKPTGTSITSLFDDSSDAAGLQQPRLVCIGEPTTAPQYIIVAKDIQQCTPVPNARNKFPNMRGCLSDILGKSMEFLMHRIVCSPLPKNLP